MIKDTGFVLLSIDNSNITNKIFSCISQAISDNPYKQICVFNSANNRVCNDRVPILHINQSKFFYGNLVVFDTASILFAKNFPNIDTIFLYATNIFWNSNSYARYFDTLELFGTKNLQFIAADQRIYDIYNNCWKQPIGICEDFNYDTIKQYI